MNATEQNTPALFANLIDRIIAGNDEDWAIVRIKRTHLKPVTDEAFLHAIQPALQKAAEARVFFLDDKRIYVVWRGEKKVVYRQLRTSIGAALVQPGLVIDPAIMISYIDPLIHSTDLKTALKYEGEIAERLLEKVARTPLPIDMIDAEEENAETRKGKPSLALTPAQVEAFRDIGYHKAYRSQLQILVVEDQAFSQRLLCEILRGARLRNNNETPLIDTACGIQDAWKIYLKKAHDLVFVDLGLADGSGHTLARAIKELDFDSYVIIVTANNYEEELSVARENNVDGFIAKPYNKKQILDCVDRYVSAHKGHARSASHGSASQF